MEWVVALVEFLVAIGVGINVVRAYFEINKIWKRKHEKPVAESVSIVAAILGIMIGLPFFIKAAFVSPSIAIAIDMSIGIGLSLILLFIGMGVWVKENEGVGLFALFLQAIHLERKESTHLLKVLLNPKGAKEILKILQQVSAIDQEIAEEEVELIMEFAKRWNIDLPELKVGIVQEEMTLLELRESVTEYLNIIPPYDQVVELIDVIELLIKSDSKTTQEEEIILAELTGMLDAYIEQEDFKETMYEVLIVPQSQEEKEKIQSNFPDSQEGAYCGGSAFSIGTFYSSKYANAICQRYQSLDLLLISVER